MVPRQRILKGLFVLMIAGRIVTAGDLLDIRGDEPLRSQINDSKNAVRLLFLGSPT